MSNNIIVPGFDNEKNEHLSIAIEKIGDLENCLVIYLTGAIDTYNVSFFQKQVVKIIEAGYTKLIFQCGALTAISSTGISAFSTFRNMLKTKSGEEIFCVIQPKVREVFDVLDFSQAFSIKESIEAAVNAFRGIKSDNKSALLECPLCFFELDFNKEGHFHCPQCKAALAVDNRGQIFLG